MTCLWVDSSRLFDVGELEGAGFPSRKPSVVVGGWGRKQGHTPQ